jgi:hypothetical protein
MVLGDSEAARETWPATIDKMSETNSLKNRMRLLLNELTLRID